MINRDDIIIESLEKGLYNTAIKELLTLWSQKVIVNLSKFFSNKKILEYIDEIDKRIQKIEEIANSKTDKDKKEDEKQIARGSSSSLKLYGEITNSQIIFNSPFVTESFQNIIRESKDIDQNEHFRFSLDNSSFIYKTEELDKSIIPVMKYKKAIIGYIDLDSLLQRIAMEAPIFYDEELNNLLLEGLCLQHTNFIPSDIFMSKIISCFNYNYSRFLKNENEANDKEEEDQNFRSRTENFAFTLDNKEKIKESNNTRIFIGNSVDLINANNINTVETFKDIESRIPYGLITLMNSYVKAYKIYSINNISLDVASKIIEVLNAGLDIPEVKRQCESEIKESKDYIKTIIELSKETPKTKVKIPLEKIYKIKNKNESFFNILKFSSKEIATELTRISDSLFSKIKPNEFFKGLFAKKDKEKTSPNICKVVDRFNILSFWVIEEVISYDHSKDRAKIIEKFIDILNELKNLNNFCDCMSIVSALGQMILTRLDKTWKKVNSKTMATLEKIKNVCNFKNNYKNMREEISKCLTEEKPFIPFLGYYTKRICFLEEAGRYVNKEGLINVDKISQVEQILNEFYKKNKIKYHFEVGDNTKNKLSILQCLEPSSEAVLEEEGNKLEPNFTLGKKTSKKRITNTEIKFEENYNKNNII
jgi:chorismate mutase